MAGDGELSDQELARRMRNGDRAACDELLKRYRGIFRGILYGPKGHWGILKSGHDHAEDAITDALVKLHRAIVNGHYDPQYDLLPYAKKVCENAFNTLAVQLGKLEKMEAEHSYSLREDGEYEEMIDSVAAPDLPAHVTAILREIVDGVLSTLSDDDRQLFVWAYVREENQDNLAQKMGLTRAAVAKRLERSRTRLARALRESGVDGEDLLSLIERRHQQRESGHE